MGLTCEYYSCVLGQRASFINFAVTKFQNKDFTYTLYCVLYHINMDCTHVYYILCCVLEAIVYYVLVHYWELLSLRI